MDTFNKYASVINQFDEWSLKKRRMKLSKLLLKMVKKHEPYGCLDNCFI